MSQTTCEHIPCKSVDKHGNTIDVFCQECTIPMTEAEHTEYFDRYYQTEEGKLWLKTAAEYDELLPGN